MAIGITACGSPPTILDVRIVDLPTTAAAAVIVDGPSGFHQVLARSQQLAVSTGVYQFHAPPVTVSSSTYAVVPAVGTVTVKSGTTSTLTVDYANVIPSTTKALNLLALHSPRVSPDGIEVPGASPELLQLHPGDVIVSGITPETPKGLIRRVVTVRRLQGSTVLTTTAATLRDAIPRGRFHIQGFIGPQTSSIAEVARRALAPLTVAKDPGNQLTDQGTSPQTQQGFDWSGACSFNAATTKHAYFDIRPFVDFEVDWGFLSVSKVVLKAGLEQDAGASISATVATQCRFDGTTKGLSLGAIEFSIAFVPIVITPELSGSGKINGSMTAGGTLGATEAFALDAGFMYDNGNLQFVHDGSPSVTWQAGIEPQGVASIEAGPALKFDVDGLGGPDVELRFEVDATESGSDVKIIGAIGVRAGIHLGFLGFNIDQDSGDILHYQASLADWPKRITPVPSPTPSGSVDAAAAIQTAIAMSCKGASHPDGDVVVGTDAAYQIFQAPSAQCFVYVFRDAAGWHTYQLAGAQYPWPQVGGPTRDIGANACGRVHASPATSSSTLTCLAPGTSYVIDGGPTYAGGTFWWHISAGGWIIQAVASCTSASGGNATACP